MTRQTQRIASCYSPTTVLLVDDSQKFLTNVTSLLDSKIAIFKTYKDPGAALHFVKNDYKFNPFTERCLLRPEERQRDTRNIEVDVRAIYQEIYNPNRFMQISIIIVDYQMPGMNGIELCQQINNRYIKKILLTGEADEKIAIDAFNKGIIHKFIRKDAADFSEVLNSAIKELQLEYFQDLSEIVINSITKNPEYPNSCLDDPVFTRFFYDLCQKHEFTEYYLVDALGSFLFLDSAGKPSWLAMKDEDNVRGAIMNAEMSDVDVPNSILEPLKKHEKIVFLFSDEELRKDPSEWLPYLHSAKKLVGRETYYYAFIEKAKLYNIHPEKILSYKAYLDQF